MNNSNLSYRDLLAKYSAQDLLTAMHWTCKKDLEQCTNNPLDTDHLWDNLNQVTKGLDEFYPSEMVKMIEFYQARTKK